MLDKNKTKSFTIVMALSLVLILVLAACGGTNTPAENNPALTDNAAENTTAEDNSAPAENSAENANDNAADNSNSNNNSNNDSSDTETAVTVSFAADVQPIITSRCENCHGGERIEADLNLLSYAGIMAGSENGAVIIPGNVSGSVFYDLIVSGEMPKRGPKVTPVELALIEAWIAEGALDN